MEEAERMTREATEAQERLATQAAEEQASCTERLEAGVAKGRRDVAQKLSAAYRAQLKVQHRTWITKFEGQVWPMAEERLTLRREEKARASEERAALLDCARLLPQRRRSMFVAGGHVLDELVA